MLSIVIPVLNQEVLFKAVYNQLRKVTGYSNEVEYLIIDNGSDNPIYVEGAKIIRNEKSTGVYPTFKQGMENTKGDVVAFFHSDMVVWEMGWDDRVLKAFQDDEKLGMVGFIGSNEIDGSGGRGLGTTSNFQGFMLSYQDKGLGGRWFGSAAYIHGKTNEGLTNAAVVDGCSMILRRSAWDNIGYRNDFPIHHFYDRLVSTQMLEHGWKIGVLGVACDHISGQTVNQEMRVKETFINWLKEKGIDSDAGNCDQRMYELAERMWLREYRDEKRIVPIRV